MTVLTIHNRIKPTILNKAFLSYAMKLQLRKLQHKDAVFIQRLFQDPQVMRFIGPVMSDEKAVNLTARMLQEVTRKTANYWVVVADINDVQMALTSVHWLKELQTIKLGIMVATEFQNMGLFKPVQAEAIELARANYPVKTFVAWTHKNNSAAEHCYKKIGFLPVSDSLKIGFDTGLKQWKIDANIILTR